jgi:myo-inositol-1-phosphate synthase
MLADSKKNSQSIPQGKLAVLTPGMGAVATTLYAGVEAIKKGLALPIGSYTQLGKIKVDLENQETFRLVKDLLPLYNLNQIVFGGWDIFPENAFEAACHAQVINRELLNQVEKSLSEIKPMKAVFDPDFVRRLNGTHIKQGPNKMNLADQLRQDIKDFMKNHNCERAVIVWCASTEKYNEPTEIHSNIKSFEEGLRQNNPSISPSQIYAYAALMEGVPFCNGSPNISVEIPCIQELAAEMKVPICGSDFKTGQTLIKTAIAPALRSRQLGLAGWFSTNILGNRDGEVLEDPESFKSKEVTKSGVLNNILDKDLYPELYSKIDHVVRINYYPPRGDNKEGWDNIDIFGWLGYPMQIKINFLCRDSILAAPLVLDLALLMDLASRSGLSGPQEWLSFYFKMPLNNKNQKTEHDLFVQMQMLEKTVKKLSEKNNK